MADIKCRKRADFEILKNNHYRKWFLDRNSGGGKGYISYGQFICHALWWHERNKGKLDAHKPDISLDKLERLCICKNNISLKRINERGLFEVSYYLGSNNKKEGILIRDKSHGCYPLDIKLADLKNPGKVKRKYGLLNHIKNIKNRWKDIVGILREAKRWDVKLEKKLDDLFFGNSFRTKH